MATKNALENEHVQPLLEAGPFLGIDTTTPPYFVSPQNLVDAENAVPNRQYGAYATVQGRVNALASSLPSAPTGIFCMHRAGQPDVYLFAVTAAGVGAIYASQLGGTPTPLTLPIALTAGQTTFFVPNGSWVFVTNGVDTPLKIDTSLVVTRWGIVKPSTAPTVTAASGGNMTPGLAYYYCTTFGTAAQESSQGTISAPITLVNTPATGTSTISGAGVAGDIYGVSLHDGSRRYNVLTSPAVSAMTAAQVAAYLAAAVANAAPEGATASSLGAVITYSVVSSTASFVPLNNLVAGSTIAATTATPSGLVQQGSTNLTAVPVSTDPQVTQRNIYRLGGALGQWRLVGTINDNTTTTFNDATADISVTGQSLTIFRDPPPLFTSIASHQGRVWGALGTNVYYSNFNEPWGFNLNTGVIPVGPNSFDDSLVNMASIGSTLILFKKRSTYYAWGTTDSDFQSDFLFNIGCDAPLSVASAYGTVFWHSHQGIYYFNGGAFDPIQNNISDGNFQQSNIKSVLDGMTLTDFTAFRGFIYERMYHLSMPSIGKTWFFDLRTHGWFRIGWSTTAVYFDLETLPSVVGANITPGVVDQWFMAETDFAQPIASFIKTRVTDTGDSRTTWTYRYFRLRAPIQSGGAVVNYTVAVNPGSGVIAPFTDPSPISLTGTPQHQRSLPDYCVGSEVQITVNVTSSAKTIIEKVGVYGWPTRVLNEADGS